MSDQLTKHDLLFTIHYSHSLADMNACYYQRMSSCIDFLLILLGAATMGATLNPLMVGLLVTVLSAFSFVVKPGEKSVLFQVQQKRYIELSTMPPADNDALQEALTVIQRDDLKTIRNFESAAYIRAGKIMGSDMSDKCLTRFQLFMAFLGGETLKRSNN